MARISMTYDCTKTNACNILLTIQGGFEWGRGMEWAFGVAAAVETSDVIGQLSHLLSDWIAWIWSVQAGAVRQAKDWLEHVLDGSRKLAPIFQILGASVAVLGGAFGIYTRAGSSRPYIA